MYISFRKVRAPKAFLNVYRNQRNILSITVLWKFAQVLRKPYQKINKIIFSLKILQLFWEHYEVTELIDCYQKNFFQVYLAFDSQSGHIWYPTTHYVILIWFTECYATPLSTKYFPSNSYLEEQRISLGWQLT